MKIFKIICALLSVLGIVRLERLAWEAILDAFSWCGTPRMGRKSEAGLYFILAAVLVFCLVKCRRKKSLLDSILRIAIMSFLAAFAIYWYFEDFFNYRWAAWW